MSTGHESADAGARRRPAALAVRLLGAFAGACVVVFFLTLFAASLVSRFQDEEDDELVAHPVSRLVGYSSLDLAELLGEPRRALPELRPPPPAITLPDREVRGFVQLQVTTDASGKVVEAAVVSAAPEGIFEEQALAIVRGRSYPAGPPGMTTEIVDFSVPASAVSGDGND